MSSHDARSSATEPAALRPAHPLVAARRVRGSPVFGRSGDRLGVVEDVAIEKRTGRVTYAILAWGGFLGFRRRRHAVPWRFLAEDSARGGYAIDCERDDLVRAQGFRSEELSSWAPPVPKVRDASLYPTTPRGIGPTHSP